ncbi:hypothetical protein DZS_08920 [Dickeya ananatis]
MKTLPFMITIASRAKKIDRFIDIGLVDSSGNLDIIEVKKPFDDKILRRTKYRGNSIPTSELSGGIMQAEKYLFHLAKWGTKGEENLTKKIYLHAPPWDEYSYFVPQSYHHCWTRPDW